MITKPNKMCSRSTLATGLKVLFGLTQLFSLNTKINSLINGTVKPYRIALTDVQRKTEFSIRSSPFACVSCRFSFGVCASCQAKCVQSGKKFWTCTKIRTDTTGQRHQLDVRYLCTGMRFVRNSCGLFVTRAFISCSCPVRIRRCPVDLIRSQTSISPDLDRFSSCECLVSRTSFSLAVLLQRPH